MSIIERAKTELVAVNFGEDDSRVMIEIMEKFFDQWDSGGAVFVVAPILQRLIAGKPLSPLTGADDEWVDMSEYSREDQRPYFQNVRCSSVFKTPEGTYDINVAGRPLITFPYWPDHAEVGSPVVEIKTGLANEQSPRPTGDDQ